MALLSVALSAGAQMLMKYGMTGPRPTGWVALALSALNPWVIAGLACYGLSAVLWLSVLSRMPLSQAYPLVALAIALVVILSWLIFREQIPLARACGVGLIVAGVVAVGLGR
jgi:multidrug transporter EmrE-like cation transporter